MIIFGGLWHLKDLKRQVWITYGHPDLWLLCSVFSMLFDIRCSLEFYTEVHFHVIYPPLLVDKHQHRNEC